MAAVDADEPLVVLQGAEVLHADDGRVEELQGIVLHGSGVHGEPDVLGARVDDGVDHGGNLHTHTAITNAWVTNALRGQWHLAVDERGGQKMMVLTMEAICMYSNKTCQKRIWTKA